MIFSAVRKGEFFDKWWESEDHKNYVRPGDDITFDDTVINIGNGMDPKSGVFTAPVSGIYSFSFSAVQRFFKGNLHYVKGLIQVMKGGEVEFYISNVYDEMRFIHDENISHSWTMSLDQNEEVKLKVDDLSDCVVMVKNDPNDRGSKFAWFNGQLLDASE